MKRAFSIAALLLLVACSSNPGVGTGTPDVGSAVDAGTTTADAGTTPGDVIPLSIGPIPLAPGEERTVCSVFRLPNAADIDVVKISTMLAPGSHHLILYKSPETTEQKALFNCQALDLSNGEVPLYIAETEALTTMPMPPGVAYKIPAGQMVKLEAHYLNATDQAVQGQGTIELTTGNDASYQTADIMFCGSVAPLLTTGVPPGVSALPYDFYQPPAGINIFGLTTHEHKRGTLMTLEKSTGANTQGTLLVNGTPYDNPPFQLYPANNLLTFAAHEGIRWQCHYDNKTTKTYHFGQSAQDDEMCFFWGYYYPSAGRFLSQNDCWQ